MTITQLKSLNVAHGGLFFARATMKRWGDTMKNFRIERLTANTVRVSRKNAVGSWIFNSHTGRMIA